MNGGSDENTSPAYSATNGGWVSGTGVFTPTSGDPSAVSPTLVGQFAHVFTDGSTTPTFIGRVTAVSSTTVTVSTTAKSGTAPSTAGTGISINVGGVWKGPNGTVSFPFGFITSSQTNSSNNLPFVNMISGTNYAITAAMTHSSSSCAFGGYTTTVRDGGKATIDGGTSGTSYILLTVSGNDILIQDLIFQNNGATGSAAGISVTQNYNTLSRVVVNNTRGSGVSYSSSFAQLCTDLEVYSANKSNTSGQSGVLVLNGSVTLDRPVIHDNTGSNNSGLFVSSASSIVTVKNGIFDTNGNRGADLSNGLHLVSDSVFYNNGATGVYCRNGRGAVIENCAFVSNGVYGIDVAAQQSLLVRNCAFYSNTSGQINGTQGIVTGSVTLTGDPFTDAANGDFRLNNTSGAGAACRGAGIGTYTQTASSYAGTVGYPDIGIQHQETGGGGGGMLFVPSLDGV